MRPSSPKVSLTTGTKAGVDRILSFTRLTYGADAHQAHEGTLEWMYEACPLVPEGLDALIAAQDEEGHVVGLVNRLYLNWSLEGSIVTMPSIGDLAVSPTHRAGGLGLRLAMAAVRGADHAFVNGSNPNSSPLFRGLRYQELVGAAWYRTILRPVRAGVRLGMHRLGLRPGARIPSPGTVDGYQCTGSPGGSELDALAALLNDHSAPVKPWWDRSLLTWRFFHPKGPRHVLVHDPGCQAALLLSFGVRRGLRMARPIAYRAQDEDGTRALLQAGMKVSRNMGADVLLAFTFDPAEKRILEDLGARRAPSVPGTFFHHRDRRGNVAMFEQAWVQGAASDLGLEAVRR
ncbi:MAG: hypothetical protein KDB96_01880 [Flavobacteriales bacterium]|nr:hypothetical protein [Flavobacteriales bacterium]